MKHTVKAKGSITKALLDGLTVGVLPAGLPSEAEKSGSSFGKTEGSSFGNTEGSSFGNTEGSSFGNTLDRQPDLTHDAGGGYNPDMTQIQS